MPRLTLVNKGVQKRTRFLVAGKQIVKLTELEPGRWFDPGGTEFALREDKVFDPVDRCGVGMAALSPDSKYTDACRPHEFMFTSATFRAFHTELEANEWLESLVEQIPGNGSWLVAKAFGLLSRVFGWMLPHEWKKKQSERINLPD